MKKIIFISLLFAAHFSWAHTLKCLYTQAGDTNSHALEVQVDVDKATVDMAKLTPYGIRHEKFEDATIVLEDHRMYLVWAENTTNQIEMTIERSGTGLLKFLRSVHGSYIVDMRCDPFEIIY